MKFNKNLILKLLNHKIIKKTIKYEIYTRR